MSETQKFSKLPFILITSLFFVWGLSNNMTDILLAAFKRIMGMTDFETSWIQVAFYGSYFCLAIPAAIFIKRYTYKSGVLVGLGLFIVGSLLFYPASISMQYSHFLSALFILASGLAILETTANPYIIAMGPEESATRRLNLAQSFNPIGSILGIVLGKVYILSHLNSASADERGLMSAQELDIIQSEELDAVMGPYVALALVLILLWVLIYFVKMSKGSDAVQDFKVVSAVKRLVKNKDYLSGIIAQFFYVGAQIGVWSFTIRYVMHELQLNEEQASTYYLASLILFMISRFVCTVLMNFFRPYVLLAVLSLIAILATICVIYVGGLAGVYALVLISGCMSLMYPTIYGLAISGLGEDTKIASSGLVMAILGGAVLTPLQGLVSDVTDSINLAFYVPLSSFFIVFLYALFINKKSKNIQ
ncbi:L-fucose:H+ symporter permease [Arenibacter sp. ARW7G5Y1]|uniref:L-fucose:H+ symporter permease n=1 Tax=Arenibacter sp. ARW7G5Y1 TaxID=2135619 RepID=UPI000D768F07|nr:L-fucose:H+ symporter permease [Arenibacter sp. ARW7G5Y1]PXX21844.1 FHS family L-fucose permease-like MFS transporter [Arenibacter sp. ARW7G5Y1]